MPSRPFAGATLHYRPADIETADQVTKLGEATLALLREPFALALPRRASAHIVQSWLGTVFRCGPMERRLKSLILLPSVWHSLSYAKGWNNFYAGHEFAGTNAAWIVVKSLRVLPTDELPQTRPSWGDPSVHIDHMTNWRLSVCEAVVWACCGRLPVWLARGLTSFAIRRLVIAPRPKSWRRTMQCCGQLAPARNLATNVEQSSQEAIDEVFAVAAWPYWTVQFLEDRFPGLLRQLFIAKCRPDLFQVEIAHRLGVPPASVWQWLRELVTAHFESESFSTQLESRSDVASPMPPRDLEPAKPLSLPEDAANPYAAPRASETAEIRIRRPNVRAAFFYAVGIVALFATGIVGCTLGAVCGILLLGRHSGALVLFILAGGIGLPLVAAFVFQLAVVGFRVTADIIRRRRQAR